MKEYNLNDLLLGYSVGLSLYSPMLGVCTLACIDSDDSRECIGVRTEEGDIVWFTKFGHSHSDDLGSCMLFPSEKEQTWENWQAKSKKSKFDLNSFKPFDKVLVRHNENAWWSTALYSYFYSSKFAGNKLVCWCGDSAFSQVIPYNEKTEFLVGTDKEAPEYYRWWEK